MNKKGKYSSTTVIASVLVMLLVLGGLFLFPFPASADTDVLIVKPAASGSGDCSSWVNACTLQTALAFATSGDEIWVKSGVHYPGTTLTDTFTLQSGVAVYGGFDGTESTRDQRDWLVNVTVLSGDIDQNDVTDLNGVVTDTVNIQGENANHVLIGSGIDHTAVLDGLVITAGQADENFFPGGNGGGMYNYESNPTLTNIIFSGNLARAGGGMYNGDNSNPTLMHVSFINNAATVGRGGGMGNYHDSNPSLTDVTFSNNSAWEAGGMYNYESSPTLTEVNFIANTASTYGGGMYNWINCDPTLSNVIFNNNAASHGGGIYNSDNSNLTLTNVNFSGNSATQYGGGIYNYYSSSSSLSDVTFSANSAPYGGGMYNYGSSPTLAGVTFSDNTATLYGGGLSNWYSSNPTLTDVTFSENSALQGSGMYNRNSSPTLTNVIFSGNTANDGGGIYNSESSSPTLTSVTLSGNSAAVVGGGIRNTDDSNPTLINIILWGNTAPDSPGIDNLSSTPQISYSDIQGCGSSGSWNSTCGTDGGGNIETDPLFVDAANGNLRLQDNSPAINVGNDAALPSDILTDLDGNPRFVRVLVDLGAYENQTFLCPEGGVLHVDQSASGLQTGDSWADALTTLQDALQVTETCELWVTEGVYYPDQGGSQADNDRTTTFPMKSGVAIYGGFAGTETSREQRDWTTNVTILSGDLNEDDNGNVNFDEPTRADNSYHVVTGASSATLDGFTITAGNANGGGSHGGFGGGMYNNNGSPLLMNITFRDNSASLGGGMVNVPGSPILVNVTFDGNWANSAGGMANGSDSSPTLVNVTFSGNMAVHGGGMYNDPGSNPILTNVTFSGNSALLGGGIYNYFTGDSQTIRNTIFWGNTAPNGGAQIYNDNECTPSVSDSVLQGGCPDGSICTNIITTDPLFVDAANGNLRLQDNSPAINVGNNAALPPDILTDLDGNPRFVRVFVDLGAYENQTFLCPVGGVLYVDQGASGLQTGNSWADALTTLQDAL
ncbi:MAG: hypothetical protein IH585_12860, partial [Anaerolineaceae bacterium]|nr:hypothetical protein [Anaerolineaceae bacterium]